MIEVESLRKNFGDPVAVDGATFTAHPGEIFGLLRPNGAGKTTTIGCISGLLTPTAGRLRVNGYDVVRRGPAARRAIGVVPQEIALYEDLSATENLEYWAGAQGMRNPALRDRIREVLELTGLQDRARDLVKKFSRPAPPCSCWSWCFRCTPPVSAPPPYSRTSSSSRWPWSAVASSRSS